MASGGSLASTSWMADPRIVTVQLAADKVGVRVDGEGERTAGMGGAVWAAVRAEHREPAGVDGNLLAKGHGEVGIQRHAGRSGLWVGAGHRWGLVAECNDLEVPHIIGVHAIGRVIAVLVMYGGSVDCGGARLAVGKVAVGIEGIGLWAARHNRGVHAAEGAGDVVPGRVERHRLTEGDCQVGVNGDVDSSIQRVRGDN